MQGFLTIVHGNVYGRLQYRPSMDNVLGRPYYRPRETSLVIAYILIVSDISQSLWVIPGLIWSLGCGRSLWTNRRLTNFSLSYHYVYAKVNCPFKTYVYVTILKRPPNLELFFAKVISLVVCIFFYTNHVMHGIYAITQTDQ